MSHEITCCHILLREDAQQAILSPRTERAFAFCSGCVNERQKAQAGESEREEALLSAWAL